MHRRRRREDLHRSCLQVESIELDGEEQPTRFWLDQYVPERPGQTIRTDFKLVMNGGCWWLQR